MPSEEWLYPAITNLYLSILFLILGIRLINHYRKNKLIETVFLSAFFNLSGLTALIIGIYEIVFQTSRYDLNPLVNAVLDILIISYLFILLIFPIVLLEEKAFIGVYGLLIGVIIILSVTLKNPLLLRGAILITAFYGVAIVFLYIYSLNRSLKALTFSIGLITLGTGLVLASQPPPILYLALFLGGLGATIIFIGQIIAPRFRVSQQQWISRLKDKVEVR